MTTDERLQKHLSQEPHIPDTAYVANETVLIGDVTLGEFASVWPGCVIRGDINFISIGDRTNVQEGTIIHLADDYGVEIGSDVTIGHGAVIHACKVESECLIGMRATIMDGAVIGQNSIIGAGSLVIPKTQIPPGSLAVGSPARIVRQLSEDEQANIKNWASKYLKVAAAHKEKFRD